MPANRSMTELMITAARVPRKYSPVNKATGKEKGRQKIRARKEVMIVPAINDKAPYCSAPEVGFHSEEAIKLKKPNFPKAGIAPLTSE